MNLLLDTHTVIWALSNAPTLSPRAREVITRGENLVFVSTASAWEIAIKKRLGKLIAPDDYLEQLERHRFISLDISAGHALAVEHLPDLHRDPFDRILVAQAMLEKLTLVTRDAMIPRYGVPIVLA
ncbi:MAG: type II toxin-antitoxin system VapC family toxin [Deltaproteobacteria bacterium]|nr:type II toxin-antitoxin system VapC family toxin [Deltaproteobacteria bacterium]